MSELRLSHTRFDGVQLLHHGVFNDHRGSFHRLFCRDSIVQAGLNPRIAQVNYTHTLVRGTVRGMHFQRSPFGERKVITCLRGEIYDVVVDVRDDSPTRYQWQAFMLSEKSAQSLIVPAGFAHGFQCLSDDVDMLYLHDQPFVAEAQTGLRYNDARLAIEWPLEVTCISDKDAALALITDSEQ